MNSYFVMYEFISGGAMCEVPPSKDNVQGRHKAKRFFFRFFYPERRDTPPPHASTTPPSTRHRRKRRRRRWRRAPAGAGKSPNWSPPRPPPRPTAKPTPPPFPPCWGASRRKRVPTRAGCAPTRRGVSARRLERGAPQRILALKMGIAEVVAVLLSVW
jgi:hypothetical protein